MPQIHIGLMEVPTQALRLRNQSPRIIQAYNSGAHSLVRFRSRCRTREPGSITILTLLLYPGEEQLVPSTITRTFKAFRSWNGVLSHQPFMYQDIPLFNKEIKSSAVLLFHPNTLLPHTLLNKKRISDSIKNYVDLFVYLRLCCVMRHYISGSQRANVT